MINSFKHLTACTMIALTIILCNASFLHAQSNKVQDAKLLKKQSFLSLWSQFDIVANKKPLDALKILETIKQKAEFEKSYANIVKADINMGMQKCEISPDSVNPFKQILIKQESWFRNNKQPVIAAVYAALIYKMTPTNNEQSIKEKVLWQQTALKDMNALYNAQQSTYSDIVTTKNKYQHISTDMLSIIGYEVNALDTIAQYYDIHGNSNTAVLCRFYSAFNKCQNEKQLIELESEYAKYGLGLDVAIKRYDDYMKDGIISNNKAVLYDSIASILNRYKNNKNKAALKYLRRECKELMQPDIRINNIKGLLSTVDTIILQCSYKNVKKLDVKVLKVCGIDNTSIFNKPDKKSNNDYERPEYQELIENYYKYCDKDDRSELKHYFKFKNVYSKSFNLNCDSVAKDYYKKLNTTTLKPGLYCLVANGKNGCCQFFAVSDVRAISIIEPNDSINTIAVNAITGKPIDNATIKTDSVERLVIAYTSTDKYMIPLELEYRSAPTNETVNMQLYTDRKLYRPGQTIHFAGIASRLDKKVYKPMALKTIDVRFKENAHDSLNIQSEKVITNDFGMFNCNFTIPNNIKRGTYYITADNNAYTSISIEDYKRPSFLIDLNKYDKFFNLGDTISITGYVRTINGLPVQNASVVCDDTINVQTDVDGMFNIPYEVSKDNSMINVKVTDGNGESHSKRYETYKYSNKKCIDFTSGLIERSTFADEVFLTSNKQSTNIDTLVTFWFDKNNDKTYTVKSNKPCGIVLPDSINTGEHTIYACCNGDTISRNIILYNPNNTKPCVKTNEWLTVDGKPITGESLTFDAGKPTTINIGCSSEAHIFYNIQSADSLFTEGCFDINDSIINHKLYYSNYHCDITVNYAWYKDNTLYTHNIELNSPTDQNKLNVTWSTMRNKLEPGSKEEWTVNITDHAGKPCKAQMIATMFDKSLDFINETHNWRYSKPLFSTAPYVEYATLNDNYMDCYYEGNYRNNKDYNSKTLARLNLTSLTDGTITGRVVDTTGEPIIGATILDKATNQGGFSDLDGNFTIMANLYDNLEISYIGYHTRTMPAINGMEAMLIENISSIDEVVVIGYGVQKKKTVTGSIPSIYGTRSTKPYLFCSKNDNATNRQQNNIKEASNAPSMLDSSIPMRENLNEVAFFYPNIQTNDSGKATLNFTLPDCMTTWKFIGIVYDNNLNGTSISKEVVAQKKFTIVPNMPRLARCGDKGTIAATISNLSDKELKGNAVMQILDADSKKVLYYTSQPFDVKKSGIQVVTFDFCPSDDMPLHTICRVTAKSGTTSDGEQHLLPILPRKELITTTKAFALNEPCKYHINLDKMLPATASNNKIAIEYTGNVAWMMLQDLHKYSKPVDECAICQALSYYSLSLTQAILKCNPNIKKTILKWRNDSLTQVSNLEHNEEFSNVDIVETPWKNNAELERQYKKDLMELCDSDKIASLQNKYSSALISLQKTDGSWSWLPSMNGSYYITLSVEGILAKIESLIGLDFKLQNNFRKGLDFIGSYAAKYDYDNLDYLYLCNLSNTSVNHKYIKKSEINKYIKMIKKYSDYQSIYTNAQCAILLYKNGKINEANDLTESIKQHTVYNKQVGRYFDTPKAHYTWMNYKIPTQAKVIEMLKLVTPNDKKTISEMQQWLLSEKRNQMWSNTIACADAVYAFVDGNLSTFNTKEHDEIIVNSKPLETKPAIEGLDYVKAIIRNDEDKVANNGSKQDNATKNITINKKSDCTSFGAVYAQYMLPIEDVVQSSTGMSITRSIMNAKKEYEIGDKITVEYTITAEQDFDFVQIQDKRAACLEPVNQISSSNWWRGYYVSNHDNTTLICVDKLSKGTHTYKVDFYVDKHGSYRSGTISAQCAYSPEYCATNKSMVIKVK